MSLHVFVSMACTGLLTVALRSAWVAWCWYAPWWCVGYAGVLLTAFAAVLCTVAYLLLQYVVYAGYCLSATVDTVRPNHVRLPPSSATHDATHASVVYPSMLYMLATPTLLNIGIGVVAMALPYVVARFLHVSAPAIPWTSQ